MISFGISDYLLLGLSGGQGIVITFANGLLLLTILLESSLRNRKEMLIIAGMAGADAIYGIGTLTQAIHHFYILWLGQENEPFSAWECLVLPPEFIINIGNQLTSIMNVVVSSDRLLAVTRPVKYHKLDWRYARNMMALVALFGSASLAAMFISTYYDPNTAKETNLCLPPPLSHSYGMYETTLNAGSGCISATIYICVFIAYYRTMSQVSSNALTNEQRAIAQQRRLTVTLGIITISTFVFYIIPFTMLAVYAWLNATVPFLNVTLLYTLVRCSTVINVLIYVAHQKEARSAMCALVRCKKATTNWVTNSSRHPSTTSVRHPSMTSTRHPLIISAKHPSIHQ